MDDSAIKPALYPASVAEQDLKPTAQVGRDHIDLRPHESYEGATRWDLSAEWTPEEEARVVRKTDLFLLSWLCLMFFGLQLDRGNIGKLDCHVKPRRGVIAIQTGKIMLNVLSCRQCSYR